MLTYLPDSHDVIISELSLEMNEKPSKTEVQIVALFFLYNGKSANKCQLITLGITTQLFEVKLTKKLVELWVNDI